jgi:hypothetical protein
MDRLFTGLALIDIHDDLARNIVGFIESQHVFDDLSGSEDDWHMAEQVELEMKLPGFDSLLPIIHRPFERALVDNAIAYPFSNWGRSRYSDGSHGVWYGADSIKTSIYESAHHWYAGLLSDAGFNKAGVISERRVFWVRCDAALINLKEKVLAFPELLNRDDYRYCQGVGARIHHEGHPGLITRSARHLRGDTIAILNSKVLSSPRHAAYFSYTLQDDCIDVREDGKNAFLTIPIQ